MATQRSILAATKLLGIYTADHFDFWMLAGPSKASCRAHILSVLEDKRIPQRLAGVTALQDSFFAIAKPAGNCMAAKDQSFVAWARATITNGVAS